MSASSSPGLPFSFVSMMLMRAPVLCLLHHLSDDQGSSGSSFTATPLLPLYTLLYMSIIKGGGRVGCVFV